MIPYTHTETSMSIFLDFVPFTVAAGHPNWDRLLEILPLESTTEADVEPLLNIAKSVATFMLGAIKYSNRSLTYNDQPLNNHLTHRIIQHMEAGQEGLAEPLLKFLEKVMENPSYRAVNGLYEWVARSGLPITPDGHILAWKAVRDDYGSIHPSNTEYNHTPGNVVEMPRWQCDEDPDQTCSTGLHFCSAAYLRNYAAGGSRIVVVKIHPADVTAIPNEYNCEKGRCCKYEIVGEVAHDKVADYYDVDTVYEGFDTMNDDPPAFAVGQYWMTSAGDEVEITEIEDHYIRTDNRTTLWLDGKAYNNGQTSCDDLVEYIGG